MSNKNYNIVFTKKELDSFVDMIDTISSLSGCSIEFTDMAKHQVVSMDRVLKRAGIKRKHS